MSYIIVGLGNPGEEYSETRHNTGRMLLEWFGKAHGAPVLSGVEGGWKVDKKLTADVAKVKVGKQTITLVLPNTFMNNSGKSVKALFPLGVTSGKAEKLLVIYDDLDLPFGKAKISFNKSSGGHKGLESIIKAIKTEKFARIRIGISPITPTGKIRKPSGEEAVTKVILGKFKPDELTQLKKLSKKVNLALETFVTSGLEKARQEFN
ncbi:MAG: Peptidyl-tRNA hydrolase [Parcubacteria group bacterium GW2011_GWF2_39_8b]|uniref:Peptidyl-tRNA hydrolase n=3 Tax=Candidatus Zambryskiibacteriota TaxID=1817925 RepID=A0A1G2T8N8_9BACT|nr:MAG: Peptidyl-tRNA hydrolase [Parcubacteria group bacterium GW2011_GWF2_39_8b]KKR45856.1 MAG: Peptidyl-tRNA hydrolase [Parcubacteria group bacterium GW2011_GWA2_40_14]OHA93647.1 MAG: hypothetical protein A2W58_02270 [Candidatus Zambryskibacteria bacterium RIFCSPHIGHO2_02_38_10.5]OHA97151.1 MAG: hypothetical protein A3C63_00840 [Candidatus Zambryskibacteria bacterium RIFCSPHIGHO2_02_FULL_39_82]OHA97762.1 MAG: hypothetical protein A3E32_03385 [Candidatus Zambryskibacteria bacterium RIFCSPHIGHO